MTDKTAQWDEIRTAYQVARLGTVSGAAQVLGVHHATVIRHIDALEDELGAKLFQRHARGYTATEAGQDLLKVAQTTDEQFSQLVSRIRGRGDAIEGELVITSLPSMTDALVPVLADFQKLYPDLIVRFLTGDRIFRLEYGEAHVAIRAGKPQELDNVVQPFWSQSFGLYAHEAYLETYGQPDPENLWDELRFVALDDPDSRAPFMRWFYDTHPQANIVFRAGSTSAMSQAILAGAGAGFLPSASVKSRPNMVELVPPRPAWDAFFWLVTHVDLHRTAKVQALLTFLKSRVKDWSSVA